jgi:hypothetical protein
MKKLINYNKCKQHLNQYCLLPFINTLPDHETKLMKLWRNLLPDRKLTERKTMEWVDIGFQGKDPATDFRGVGILGLEQLL